MITAAEALQLPSAQLTDDERIAADKLAVSIDEHIRENMTRGGCDIHGKETNPKVLAEMNQRLVAAGWKTNWQKIVEKHKLNQALTQTIGFYLALSPSEEAYRTTMLQ